MIMKGKFYNYFNKEIIMIFNYVFFLVLNFIYLFMFVDYFFRLLCLYCYCFKRYKIIIQFYNFFYYKLNNFFVLDKNFCF